MILRSLGKDELADAAAGKLPRFHRFVFTPGHAPESTIAAIEEVYQTRGLGYAVTNIKGCPEWEDNGWITWAKRNLPTITAIAGPRLGKVGLYPWNSCEGGAKRELIDWSLVTQDNLIRAARKATLAAAAESHTRQLFLDNFFPTVEPWMFDPSGARYEDFPLAKWTYYRKRQLRFRELIAITGADAPLVNIHPWTATVPGPVYIEHAERDMDSAIEVWHRHPENVLSVDPQARASFDELLWLEREHQNKWVSLAGPDDQACAEGFLELAKGWPA